MEGKYREGGVEERKTHEEELGWRGQNRVGRGRRGRNMKRS